MSLAALVLAGGSGTRFWPASRRSRPKQLLTLEGTRSLLQMTVDRLAPLVTPDRIWVATTEALAAAVGEQLPELGADRLLIEPASRNTAPAIGYALGRMPAEIREGAVAVLPADHRIADPEAFRATLAAAERLAACEDRILALGVVPRWPETGFGYLELDDGGPGPEGERRVARFREKPDRATAEAFVASDRHLWNAGMFVFRGSTLLDRLERLAPELGDGLREVSAASPERLAETYGALPSISIDYALMEKLDELWTLPLDCGWDDLGSWQALYEILAADGDGNRGRGAAFAVDAKDNLLFSDAGAVAVLGVEGLVVVRTGDAVLVVPRERAQEVRRLVDLLEASGRTDLL